MQDTPLTNWLYFDKLFRAADGDTDRSLEAANCKEGLTVCKQKPRGFYKVRFSLKSK
jgi:hypothetical protein